MQTLDQEQAALQIQHEGKQEQSVLFVPFRFTNP